LSGKETITLILSITIPFLIIIGILFPFSSGIHGKTHSEGGNEYLFEGEIEGDTPSPINESNPGFPYDVRVNYTGHFTGDAFIGDNTGWVFCNGKVRYSGELHVRNAEFDYHIVDEQGFGTLGPHINFQKIELNGDRGEMEEGFPYYLLGFLGSAFGFILWISIYFSKKDKRQSRIVPTITAFTGIIGGPSVFLWYNTYCGGFTSLCIFIIWLIFTVSGILIFANFHRISLKKRYLQETNPYWFIIMGILLLTTCIMIFMYPDGISREIYCRERALGGVYFGIIGMLSSAGLIGAGLGRNYHQKMDNNASLD